MVVVKPESRPELPVYDNYEFFDEQINASLMDKLKESMFTSSFIPNPPKDYQIVKRPYEPQAAGQPQIPNQLQQAPTQPGQRSGQPPVQPGNGNGSLTACRQPSSLGLSWLVQPDPKCLKSIRS